MFTTEHFVLLGITILLMIVAFIVLFKFKPSLKLVLTIACVICVISEVVKTFSSMQFDWMNLYDELGNIEGKQLVPFIEMDHFPLHLCAIQVFLIFIVRFLKPTSKVRTVLLGFMYPTMAFGATLALFMPGELSFINPRSYQYFFFHGMLVVLGIYIMLNKEIEFKPKHYLTSIILLAGLGFASIYANSLFAQFNMRPDGSYDLLYMPNLFFTMRSPAEFLFIFTEPYHWYIYLACVFVIAFIVFALFYIPVFVKAKRNKK